MELATRPYLLMKMCESSLNNLPMKNRLIITEVGVVYFFVDKMSGKKFLHDARIYSFLERRLSHTTFRR